MREHLATLLDDFRRFDRGIAVVHYRGVRRRATSYGEIARLAGRFAALLAAQCIGPGDRVVLWAENSAEWIAAFYGIMLRGALAVPLDAYGSADFAVRVAADVRPKLAVGDAGLLRQLSAVLTDPGGKDRNVARARHPEPGLPTLSAKPPEFEIPTIAFEDWDGSLPAEEAGPVPGLSRETPLQILFTSGTTGEPKGIVHTHGNVLASVEPIERGARPYMRYERIFHPLRFLHTLPLSHVFGQTMGLWVPAIFAAEVHFESRLVAPRLVETIKRERISVLCAVPRVMALLKTHLEISRPGLAARLAASKGISAWARWWRFRGVHNAFGFKFWALISGGGALAGPLEQFWNGLGFVVVQGYGMTETTALITLNHPFHVASGTIGKPLPGREVKLGPDGEVLVRGPMISNSTWSHGELKTREDEWLATGDLAETQATGELRFLGRKSETIVTAAGVNVHPEDLEAAIEQEPEVAACAVVPVETPNGPEPCAVLAVRGAGERIAEAVERANARLAEFQRVRRWVLWPEPDLPRTSTGKVRRKTVAAWLDGVQAAAVGNVPGTAANSSAGGDWLLALLSEIAGEMPPGAGDDLRLSEDLHLDSLGRVQLEAALEERLGMTPAGGEADQARTLGDLRKVIAGDAAKGQNGAAATSPAAFANEKRPEEAALSSESAEEAQAKPSQGADPFPNRPQDAARERYIYPHWPWWGPVGWARTAFIEAIAQPLVWLLANPRVARGAAPSSKDPMLIVCNHVTAYDGPLVEYALPGAMRRRMAVAMSGEMLEDFRHFRNPEGPPGQRRFMLFGPAAYLLLTALYNVFPLPRRRDFQRSFAHAGEALDRGMNVLVFPEGTRSEAGELARFRPGIGMLAKQAGTAVLPVAIRGLGELKAGGGRWFRSGTIAVRVGEPIRFTPEESESEIAARLHAEVARLLNG
jgi:long-chain acyl-CoA synthetase